MIKNKFNSLAKAKWFINLAKLPPKQRCKVICCGKSGFFRDLQRLVKHVGRDKNIKLSVHHKKLFKKHKKLLKKIAASRSPKKLQRLLLKKVKGGAFPLIPLLAGIIPSLVDLAITELPKLFN